MDREISKEVRQKEQRKQFIKLGAGIGIAVVLIGGVIGFMQTSLQRKDLVFSTVDKGVIEVSVSASGKVVPAFEEIINSPINSRIVEIYKKGGDSVDVHPRNAAQRCRKLRQRNARLLYSRMDENYGAVMPYNFCSIVSYS